MLGRGVREGGRVSGSLSDHRAGRDNAFARPCKEDLALFIVTRGPGP